MFIGRMVTCHPMQDMGEVYDFEWHRRLSSFISNVVVMERSISEEYFRYKASYRQKETLEGMMNSERTSKLCEEVRRVLEKLTCFLACQSNPDLPLRGSWLLAFSLQSVIRVSLHFDLIRPIGMAPNKNQSSGWSERGSGQRRTS